MLTSGNANGSRTLKRMKLVYKNIAIQLAVNPEEYSQKEPSHSTVTHTKGGAWIDAWGADLIEITFSGVTGVRGNTADTDEGYRRWVELRDLFRSLYKDAESGEEITELIKLYNFTDNEFFECYPLPQGIELSRSKSRPHIYHYSVGLMVVGIIGSKPPAGSSRGVIGNPFSSTSNNSYVGGSGSIKEVITNSNVSVASSGDGSSSLNGLTNPYVDNAVSSKVSVKPIEVIVEESKKLCASIEPLLGGRDGRLSPPTGYGCKKGLHIQPSGSVESVFKFKGADLTTDESILINEIVFTPVVSKETYELSEKIHRYSPEVLSPAYWAVLSKSDVERVSSAAVGSTQYDSTIYEEIVRLSAKSIISKTEENYIRVVMLESFRVYLEAYSVAVRKSIVPNLTVDGINTLLTNIRSVIIYFEITFEKREVNRYEHFTLCSELRKLEECIEIYKAEVVKYL